MTNCEVKEWYAYALLFHHDVERDADVSLSLISTEEKERYKLWEPTSAVGMSLYRFKTSRTGLRLPVSLS